MKYLLDTCVLSELTKPRPDKAVLAWIEGLTDADAWVSVLTLGELEKGIARLSQGPRRHALKGWLDGVRSDYDSRLLDVTDEVASKWGRSMARAEARGAPLPVIDALIGATAIVHGLTVATRNVPDVARTGAPTFNPWKG